MDKIKAKLVGNFLASRDVLSRESLQDKFTNSVLFVFQD